MNVSSVPHWVSRSQPLAAVRPCQECPKKFNCKFGSIRRPHPTAEPTSTMARGGGASAKTTAGRERWLARAPEDDVKRAALEHEWSSLAVCKAHTALEALGNLEPAYTYGALDGVKTYIVNCHKWLTDGARYPDVKRDVARAYLCTFEVQKSSEEEKNALAELARCMRDLTVVTIIVDAGGHTDWDMFNHSLSTAFDGSLCDEIRSQIAHSYHQMLHKVSGKFLSGCAKKGRRRPARGPRDSSESSAGGLQAAEWPSTASRSSAAAICEARESSGRLRGLKDQIEQLSAAERQELGGGKQYRSTSPGPLPLPSFLAPARGGGGEEEGQESWICIGPLLLGAGGVVARAGSRPPPCAG